MGPKMELDRVKFWLVWNPQGRSPTHRHPTRQMADQEARRLALLNPDQDFFVLKAMGGLRSAKPAEPETLRMIEDPIPF